MNANFCAETTLDLGSDIYQDALFVRREVFIKEQHVSEALEIDGEENCQYFVLYQENKPIATARMRSKFPIAKVERVAVIQSARKSGAGREIMRMVEKAAQEKNHAKIILGAQDHAIDFYKKLGYRIISNAYLDADIIHHDMEKIL